MSEIHNAIAKGIAKELGVKCHTIQADNSNPNADWYWLKWKGTSHNDTVGAWLHDAIIIQLYNGRIYLNSDTPTDTNYLCNLSNPDLINIIKTGINNDPRINRKF